MAVKGKINLNPETKQIYNILSQIQQYSFGRIFHDWLKGIVRFLSGSQISEYKRTLDNYSREEGEVLGTAFNKLIELQEKYPYRDILGELYEGAVTFGENGQYFTPAHIGEFMSGILNIANQKKGGTYIDPTCGSGSLLLQAAKRDKDGFFMGIDIDERCFLMTTINLTLNGLTGIVVYGNALSGEYRRIFATNPFSVVGKMLGIVDITNNVLYRGYINIVKSKGYFNKDEIGYIKNQLKNVNQLNKQQKDKQPIENSLFDFL